MVKNKPEVRHIWLGKLHKKSPPIWSIYLEDLVLDISFDSERDDGWLDVRGETREEAVETVMKKLRSMISRKLDFSIKKLEEEVRGEIKRQCDDESCEPESLGGSGWASDPTGGLCDQCKALINKCIDNTCNCAEL